MFNGMSNFANNRDEVLAYFREQRFLALYEQRLEEEQKRKAEETEKERKERLAMEMALSCSSAKGLMSIFKSVFGDNIPAEYKEMVSDLLAVDAKSIKPKELSPELRELAGAQMIYPEHARLAKDTGFSIGISDGYSIADLKSVLQDRVRAIRA